jgi:hypothetical protein
MLLRLVMVCFTSAEKAHRSYVDQGHFLQSNATGGRLCLTAARARR